MAADHYGIDPWTSRGVTGLHAVAALSRRWMGTRDLRWFVLLGALLLDPAAVLLLFAATSARA